MGYLIKKIFKTQGQFWLNANGEISSNSEGTKSISPVARQSRGKLKDMVTVKLNTKEKKDVLHLLLHKQNQST